MNLEKAAEKIVVIGGSHGAIEALIDIVPHLPADIPAAIFVVVHVPVEANSYLPTILARRGPLRVHHANEGEIIRAGHIYVAPPNHHLTVDPGLVHVRKGPRENRHRPAIDPLFRTAARAYGPAVVAVVLSGNLDDGSAGLLVVRNKGGLAVVQDPSDARASDMPRRALEYAGADYILPVAQIAPKLVELVNSRDVAMKKSKNNNGRNNKGSKSNKGSKKGNGASEREVRANEEVTKSEEGNGKPSVFACPECSGVLWEVKEGRLVRYRCRVGHGYASDSLKTELDESAERALWAAVRSLEEKAAMTRRMMESAKGPTGYLDRLEDQAQADVKNAEVIRDMILD